MSKLNFAIALKMTTDQFKQGADIVKSGIKNIQYQVLGMASALGLGTIGLKNLVSSFISVARETTRARVALRNISGDAAGFAKNMDFLLASSSRWGQELNGMTSEYAKFSAAASSAGIPVAQQQEIFESFTRSITAFGMKSDEAHLAYLALSQMMSKGKVSSEELRRQLGEKMPVAMEAMARAVGVTIQELDGLLKAGKLISKEVMLPFVKEMEKMLPEVNVDNIETSINRLSNSFIKLTQDLKIGEMYKKIVDGANNMLSNIQTSFARIALVIVNSIIGGKIIGAFMQLRVKSAETNNKILAEKVRTEQQMEVATAKRIAAEKRYNDLSTLYAKASNDQKLAHYGKLVAAESAMNKTRLGETAARTAMETAAAAKTTTVWTLAWRNIRSVAVTALATIRTMMASIVPMAIIGLITNVVMKLIEARKEAERIKNIFTDYQSTINKSSSANLDIKKLETLNSLLKDAKTTDEERKKIQNEIYGLLGGEIDKQEDINTLVYRRIALLREAARAEALTSQYVEKEEAYKGLQEKYTKKDESEFIRMLIDYQGFLAKGMARSGAASATMAKRGEQVGGFKAIKTAEEFETAIQDRSVMKDIMKRLPEAVKGSLDLSTGSTEPTPPSKPDGKESPLEKAEKKYAEELEKLTNQKEASVISTEAYNKAIDDLNKATYEEIGGILGANSERNETFQKAKHGVENQLSSSDKLTEITNDLNENLRKLDEKRRNGLLSESEYNNELLNLIDATTDKIASLDKVGEAERQYIANLNQMKGGLVSKPERKKRDTTFDYKKSKSDILSEELSLQEKYLDKVRGEYEKLKDEGVNALAEIAKEEEKVKTLSEAVTLAQLKEDIEKMELDKFSKSIDGITGFADGLDRVTKSWERLNNQDLSGFERMVAIINAMGDTIKGVISAWESYKAVQELISNLDKARESQLAIKTAAETASISEIAAAKVAADATEAASTATKVAAVVPLLAAQEVAATGVMAAESTAAYASIPFAGPALAAGQIAAMQAMITAAKAVSSIPGFEKGGIVGGASKSGDRNIIRVNGGEMVVPSGYQSRLWDAIQTGKLGGGLDGKVKFEIEGDKLRGVLENYNAKRSRI